MDEQIRVFRQSHRCKGLAVFFDYFTETKAYRGKPVEFEEVTEIYAQDEQPALTINENAAQQLMDDLWQCGLRPTEGTGSAGSLAATQRHLEDMRKIAFKKLNIQGDKNV